MAKSVRSTANTHAHPLGFTLIEVVIAMLIISIIGAVLLATLKTVTTSWSAVKERGERLEELQRLSMELWYDTSQNILVPDASLLFSSSLEFTPSGDMYILRAGWLNPFNQPRSNLQYVHYRSQDDHRLMRFDAPTRMLDAGTTLKALDDTLHLNGRTVAAHASLSAELSDANNVAYAVWPAAVDIHALTPDLLTLHITMEPYDDIEMHIPFVIPQINANENTPLSAR